MSERTELISKQEPPNGAKALSKEKMPFISVIVPVYNDAKSLRLCLQSLKEQIYPADRFEVIIVDNNSTNDDPQNVVADFPGYQCKVETKIGSYAARNKGISLARGEVFAFIDSDCIASPHWLVEGVRTLLAHPECGLVGGLVDVFAQDSERPSSVELYERVTAFQVRKWIQELNRCVTANLLVWAEVFEKVGLFDETLKSGGDFEWSSRVHKASLELIYDEKARVRHPARRTWRQIINLHRRLEGGLQGLRKLHNRPKRHVSIFRRIYRISVPPIHHIRECYSDELLRSRSERLRVVMVFVFLHYVRVLERVRLSMGLATKRK